MKIENERQDLLLKGRDIQEEWPSSMQEAAALLSHNGNSLSCANSMTFSLVYTALIPTILPFS